MVGICGLSVDEKKRESFSRDLFLGTFYQQHLDQDWSGLAIVNKEGIQCQAYPGLFRPNFEERIEELEGDLGIGYCGIANEPFKRDTKLGELAACFAGNIQNCLELKEKLINQGISFSDRRGEDLDIEVIINLIAQGKNVVDGIKKMTQEIKGTYTLLVLTEKEIIAARHPSGHWPLILGEKEEETIVASSSAGFPNLGFEIVRDLQPGEIISIRDGKFKSEALMPTKRAQMCSWWWLYPDDPFGIREGVAVSEIRKKLGAKLAQKDIKNGFIPDIISSEPASGTSYAIGYYQEFCRQRDEEKIKKLPKFDEVLIKYGYTHRSFIWKKPEKRGWEAGIKHLPSPEDHRGEVIVLVDDSIVRGTTKTKVIEKIRKQGFKEIHLRIGSPELYSDCEMGKGLKRGETLTSRLPAKEERVRFLGVDSLEHNSLEELFEVFEERGISRDSLCVDCFLKK
ncbi:MAG: hypothetical protein QME61_03055 [Patescibacteria group bacterium]|nr:hypothetical protein [Patescibacteria group bacterium]